MYFAVVLERGGSWDWSLPMRLQKEWDAHAAFMDALAADGFIVAGGPLGDEDSATRILHIVQAPEKSAVLRRLLEDPWQHNGMLKTGSVEPWTVLLGTLR